MDSENKAALDSALRAYTERIEAERAFVTQFGQAVAEAVRPAMEDICAHRGSWEHGCNIAESTSPPAIGRATPERVDVTLSVVPADAVGYG